MKKRFSKAARQTLLAAVTLALLLSPFVCLGVQKVKNEALDSAFLWTIHAPHDVETYLSEHGLRPDSMPVSGTPDWYQLRVFLSIASSQEGWETPVILQYKDAQRNPTVQRSGLFAHCVDSDFSLLDFTDFTAKDLRALYACPSGCSIQLYGKLVTTEYWKIICLNRVCIDGTEWTAQTPVDETDHYEIRSDDLRWNFENRAELESYLDVVKVFPAATRELCGEKLTADESELLTGRDGPSYIRESISYGTVFARHAVNWCDDLFPTLRLLALRTAALYLLLLFALYRFFFRE